MLKYALQGKQQQALAAVTPELEAVAEGDMYNSWFVAECYALIDEKEQALDWLDKAIENGFLNYPLLSEFDPFLDNIRGEARFHQLMDTVKQQWEQFEV